jgi:hypothetical protein
VHLCLIVFIYVLVAEALDGHGALKWKVAHFDNEPAVYKTFKRKFPDVDIKMCAFHVKQALNRMVMSFISHLIFILFCFRCKIKDWLFNIAMKEKCRT